VRNVREQAAFGLGAPRHSRRRDGAKRVELPPVGQLVERREQRTGERVADDGEDLHRVALHCVPHLVRFEARAVDEHDRTAAAQRGEGDEQTGAVHQRARGQRGRRPLTRADGRDRIARLRARTRHLPQRDVQVVVAPHDTLRHPGRATGVQEDQVVTARLTHRGAGGCAGERPLVPAARLERDRTPRCGDASDGHAYRRPELRVVDDDPRAGVLEQVVDLLRAVAVVDVDRHAAELHRRVEGLEILGPVDHVDRDPVAGFEPGPAEMRGEAPGAVGELAEGQPPGAADERVTPRILPRDSVPDGGEAPIRHAGRLRAVSVPVRREVLVVA
jgi:hypothetical protein